MGYVLQRYKGLVDANPMNSTMTRFNGFARRLVSAGGGGDRAAINAQSWHLYHERAIVGYLVVLLQTGDGVVLMDPSLPTSEWLMTEPRLLCPKRVALRSHLFPTN